MEAGISLAAEERVIVRMPCRGEADLISKKVAVRWQLSRGDGVSRVKLVEKGLSKAKKL